MPLVNKHMRLYEYSAALCSFIFISLDAAQNALDAVRVWADLLLGNSINIFLISLNLTTIFIFI